MKISTFDDALNASEAVKTPKGKGAPSHVLLGNGFSISLKPELFAYSKLFEKAKFVGLERTAPRAFEALETHDFEEVMRGLEHTAALGPIYVEDLTLADRVLKDRDALRELLVKTIAGVHPARPADVTDGQYRSCRAFLAHFDSVYTLNYDLLLYWTMMHCPDDEENNFDDGFRSPDEDYADYVSWEVENTNNQNVHFLHGGLHLFDAGHELQKYTWCRTGIPLIDQIRTAMGTGKFPLFVSEATSQGKMRRILHSGYLHRSYRSVANISGTLFVHGHSLSDNDMHVLRLIPESRISLLAVSVHGDPTTAANKKLIARVKELAARRKHGATLKTMLYDADSAKVWTRRVPAKLSV